MSGEQNPYPGLRPFKFEESYLFFGREGQSEDLLRRLKRNHFVAVVGTSGSGKSSLVRAGLLPLLSSGFMPEAGASWRIAIFRPGNSPIQNLAQALVHPEQADAAPPAGENKTGAALDVGIAETFLRRSAVGLLDYADSALGAEENLLVVVDQFEELFRFKKDSGIEKSEDEAAAFVKLFLEATRDKTERVYVIITMRSDFLGDCSQFRDLPEAINDGQYLIPRLSRDQLRQVIESPAKVHGVEMSPALVTNLLNAIGDDQDQLPVLQHSLMRTWDKWAEREIRNSKITDNDYESRNNAQ
ncbi:MAG TPA: ATP-binding protein [Pyrinomonadaceae bacterium]|jgi:energy-coupling factor transporter ATP-binding protein EcfA2